MPHLEKNVIKNKKPGRPRKKNVRKNLYNLRLHDLEIAYVRAHGGAAWVRKAAFPAGLERRVNKLIAI
jgi:hypothetical protein